MIDVVGGKNRVEVYLFHSPLHDISNHRNVPFLAEP